MKLLVDEVVESWEKGGIRTSRSGVEVLDTAERFASPEECLDYLKADGAAYRRAVTFDRIGQITERFVKLQIGEIRKTADSYFVFAGESIEITEGDETFPSDGFMVYEMVPVGEELKIKDYYDITN
jgi:hypothetical protein